MTGKATAKLTKAQVAYLRWLASDKMGGAPAGNRTYLSLVRRRLAGVDFNSGLRAPSPAGRAKLEEINRGE